MPASISESSDYNLILKFFHKKQIIIFVFPLCNPSIFSTRASHTSGTMQLIAVEVLQANIRITTCQETWRQ